MAICSMAIPLFMNKILLLLSVTGEILNGWMFHFAFFARPVICCKNKEKLAMCKKSEEMR